MIRFVDRSLTALAGLATAGLAVAIAMVAADILVRKILGRSLTGAVDVTELAVVIVAFLSIPLTFLRRGHVAVEIVTNALPLRGRAILEAIGALVGGLLFLTIAIASLQPARLSVAAGDVSQDLAIPLLWYWVPTIGGCLLATLAATIAAWQLFAGQDADQ
jgi:TRAP-type C4-dicarboxylate transport system permease small subunit